MHTFTCGSLSERDVMVVGGGAVGGYTVGAVRPHRRRHAIDLIGPLLALADGWDGHGAAAPSRQALTLASQFLAALTAAPFPDVMPSVDGGVILEWEGDEVDLVIEILGTRQSTVYVRRGDIEEEGPLSAHRQAAAEALAALSVAAD